MQMLKNRNGTAMYQGLNPGRVHHKRNNIIQGILVLKDRIIFDVTPMCSVVILIWICMLIFVIIIS